MGTYELMIENIYKALTAKLTTEQKEKFVSTIDIDDKLQFAEGLLKQHKLLPNIPTKILKHNKKSMHYLDLGNEYLTQDSKRFALEHYNKAVAFAETDSILLSNLYVYRSKAFIELKLYSECLRDIDLAMKSPAHLTLGIKHELRKRKELCEIEIKKSSSSFSKCQEDINDLIKLSGPKHPKVPFIINCLELIHTPYSERSIKTNKDLKPGDVIAIEKPFTYALDHHFRYRCCTYCLKENVSLIPCPTCTSVMFCNQKCMKIAYAKFHKYECDINFLLQIIVPNRLISIRVLLQAISIFKDIDRFINFERYANKDINIFTINSNISGYYDIDDDDNDDNDDKDKDYSLELKDIHYYPMHLITSGVTEPNNLENDEYIYWAIEAIVTTYQLTKTLKDFIKIDGHKRYIRNFIYHQYAVVRSYFHELCYRQDLSSELPVLGYGSGIYTFSGLINHSCAPNIFRNYNGSIATIVVLRPIKKDEHLFSCYGEYFPITEKSQRQENLKKYYYFDCICEACEKNFPILEKLPKGLIPSIIETTKISNSNVNFKDIIESIRKMFKYLNTYSTKKNYPCLEIYEAETQVRYYFSYVIRNRFTTI